MEETKPLAGNHPQQQQQQQQQQLLYQHQLQQRQQQMLLLQQLQKQQQQQAAMSRFPSNIDVHLRPPGSIQTRPIVPPQQNPNPNPSLGQPTPNLQQQQQVVASQQMLQQQQQQQQQQKLMRPLNHIELQFAYQDAWRVCHPDFKRPFSSLEDACERLVNIHPPKRFSPVQSLQSLV